MKLYKSIRQSTIWALLKLIQLYQYCISPLLPPSCRFYPTCSNYALEVIKEFGIVKGIYLSTIRISKCHPLTPPQVDLPPKK